MAHESDVAIVEPQPMQVTSGRATARCSEGGRANSGPLLWRLISAPPASLRHGGKRTRIGRNGERVSESHPHDVTLRPWTPGDAPELVRLGDDRDIWLNLRERFPHPFTPASADLWLAEHASEDASRKSFAVLYRGQLAGGIYLRRHEDIRHICADLTFWVGRPFWVRGIAQP